MLLLLLHACRGTDANERDGPPFPPSARTRIVSLVTHDKRIDNALRGTVVATAPNVIVKRYDNGCEVRVDGVMTLRRLGS